MIALVISFLLAWYAPPGLSALNTCSGRTASGPAAYVVVDRITGADSLASVTICIVADAAHLRLGGYHGELTLPRSTRVVKVERPSGGTRIENTTVAGRVSFAGVASEGVTSGAILGLTIARRSARDDAQLRLTLIDVTDINGRDVRSQIAVDSMPRLPQSH